MSERSYSIKVAAELCGMHEQSLRLYERRGLISPSRTPGNARRFTDADIEQIRFIKRLVDDLGVNLAGVEVIMHMRRQLLEAQREIEELRASVMGKQP
ncbi:MAG: helix-turn-helix transcriptional regulator [Chloroflexota bacterium]|nr:MAG: MerR family DNA-binding transcriptional regulator [Chloroflexota bacterium]